MFSASIATSSFSSSLLASSKFNQIGLSKSLGSNITTSSALSLGINGNTSLAKSPCGSMIHTHSQFVKSCLAITCIILDLPVPVCQIT
ncbi:hypothetical protein HOF65_04885 [bacterium]|nr:hypothetical protein [bacterium]